MIYFDIATVQLIKLIINAKNKSEIIKLLTDTINPAITQNHSIYS